MFNYTPHQDVFYIPKKMVYVKATIPGKITARSRKVKYLKYADSCIFNFSSSFSNAIKKGSCTIKKYYFIN